MTVFIIIVVGYALFYGVLSLAIARHQARKPQLMSVEAAITLSCYKRPLWEPESIEYWDLREAEDSRPYMDNLPEKSL